MRLGAHPGASASSVIGRPFTHAYGAGSFNGSSPGAHRQCNCRWLHLPSASLPGMGMQRALPATTRSPVCRADLHVVRLGSVSVPRHVAGLPSQQSRLPGTLLFLCLKELRAVQRCAPID